MGNSLQSPTRSELPADAWLPPRSPRRQRALWIFLSIVVLGAGAAVWVVLGGDGGGESRESTTPRATATIERRDLIETETFEGTLGFEDERTIAAGLPGTITFLPEEGSRLTRGEVVYRIDQRRTILMYGRLPFWRPLDVGAEGKDVKQLELNLLELGFDADGSLKVDGIFDASTAEAVAEWEDDLGVEVNGLIQPGEVLFQAGARRVGPVQLEVGAQVAPGTPLFATTTTIPVVALPLDADRQELVDVGDRVEVELTDDSVVRGRISEIGRVASLDEMNPDAEPTIDVTITLREGASSRLDGAPVDVDITSDVTENVLAVPVAALLALAEGGYGVELWDGSERRLVAVEAGAVASGFVEISGEEIAEGSMVVVAE